MQDPIGLLLSLRALRHARVGTIERGIKRCYCGRVLVPCSGQGMPRLTPREREILTLMFQGNIRNDALAARLVVSENTVRFHLRRLLQRTATHSRAELLAWGIRSSQFS